MGMNKTKIKKFINLNNLPRDDKNRIMWKQSVGSEIDFMYGDIVGILKILQCKKGTDKALVYIDGYTESDGKLISVDQIKTCSLGNILRRPIAFTHPELVKYFVNEVDAYTLSACSGKKALMKCPDCGAINYKIVQDVTKRGFSCSKCSDGISWPQKFIHNILSQSNIKFNTEVTKNTNGFSWVNNYRYDFYFDFNGQGYFIEADGGFHYSDAFGMRERYNVVDKEKDLLASLHNINMIRINCNYNSLAERFEFIKNNIVNSELKHIINFSKIDWAMASKYASSSYIIKVASMWDSGIFDKKKISQDVGISISMVRAYLKIAASSGFCTYNKEFDDAIKLEIVERKCEKPVLLLKDNKAINVFKSASDLDRKSMGLYGIHLLKQHIAAVCRGARIQTGGYTMKYITKEEYAQLLPQFQQYKINETI